MEFPKLLSDALSALLFCTHGTAKIIVLQERKRKGELLKDYRLKRTIRNPAAIPADPLFQWPQTSGHGPGRMAADCTLSAFDPAF